MTGNLLTKAIAIFALTASFQGLSAMPSAAASEDACAIWLCLPGGFVPGACSGPRKEFLRRLRKGRSPLPSLSSCSNGQADGSYSLGYERFETCPAGWTTSHDYPNDDDGFRYRSHAGYGHRDVTRGAISRICTDPSSCRTYGRDDERRCSSRFRADTRPTPYYIDMTIDGQKQERYWYDLSRR